MLSTFKINKKRTSSFSCEIDKKQKLDLNLASQAACDNLIAIIILALVLAFDSHRGEILNLIAKKCKK